ncbi:MAG: hypothetical protein V2A56_13080, partial [bacterium]
QIHNRWRIGILVRQSIASTWSITAGFGGAYEYFTYRYDSFPPIYIPAIFWTYIPDKWISDWSWDPYAELEVALRFMKHGEVFLRGGYISAREYTAKGQEAKYYFSDTYIPPSRYNGSLGFRWVL